MLSKLTSARNETKVRIFKHSDIIQTTYKVQGGKADKDILKISPDLLLSFVVPPKTYM